MACAWFAFRWYHLPIRQGAGWAWGARSRDRAFWVGVGVGGYVGVEGWGSAASPSSSSGESSDELRGRGDDDVHGIGHAADLETGGEGVRMASLNGPGLDGSRDSGVAQGA